MTLKLELLNLKLQFELTLAPFLCFYRSLLAQICSVPRHLQDGDVDVHPEHVVDQGAEKDQDGQVEPYWNLEHGDCCLAYYEID